MCGSLWTSVSWAVFLSRRLACGILCRHDYACISQSHIDGRTVRAARNENCSRNHHLYLAPDRGRRNRRHFGAWADRGGARSVPGDPSRTTLPFPVPEHGPSWFDLWNGLATRSSSTRQPVHSGEWTISLGRCERISPISATTVVTAPARKVAVGP